MVITSESFHSHLDLKPSNILLNTKSDGSWNKTDLVISDFGTCAYVDKISAKSGTPGFTPAEQILGEPHRNSDIYSLGKLIIFILADWTSAWNFISEPVFVFGRPSCVWACPESAENPKLYQLLALMLTVSYYLNI